MKTTQIILVLSDGLPFTVGSLFDRIGALTAVEEVLYRAARESGKSIIEALKIATGKS